MKRTWLLLSLILLTSGVSLSAADPGRFEQSLSGENWTLRLDPQAEWESDELFLPPVDVSTLPVNPPTGGWDDMGALEGKTVHVPGTVEEYYWGRNGNFVGTAGDYRGVSWWSTSFTLDPKLKGKRIVLAFGGVNLRAEVFVNRKLVGYDIVGNTPFEVDATGAVEFGAENRLDVRITDAGGNFSWPAHIVFQWGKYTIPIVRGFGGITEDVTLRALDPVNVSDVWVQNTPKPTEARIYATVNNTSGAERTGVLTLVIHEYKNPAAVLFKKEISTTIPTGEKNFEVFVSAPTAKLWDLHKPSLYIAKATFTTADGSSADSMGRRFGFRWFTIGDKAGDKRFYLNGKRVFLMAAVNRGYWAENGTYCSPAMAKKDVETAISLGYNALAYHNAIAQQNLVDATDEHGLLATGESAGYRINDNTFDPGKPVQDEFARALRREKLFRFVKRDRSCPSLVAYMLKNEEQNPPEEDDMRNLARMRELDPSRIILYTGDRLRSYPAYEVRKDDKLKLFYTPYDSTEHYYGWFDMHHWNPAPGYLDDYYRNPRNYMRFNIVDGDSAHHVRPDEIIFYGEEGAFGTMLGLGKIRDILDAKDSPDGWREREHLNWYDSYDRFLDEAGFRPAFPTVDDLTTALGRNMHYFHGRIVENARISNVIDAYNLNGWGSAATHTDIADAYRNATADSSILSYYTQPLYVAVKIRDKVLPKGASGTADIYLVNEKNLKGPYTLELELKDPDGATVLTKWYPVTILGGEEFGQLLQEGVTLPPMAKSGYYILNARITSKGALKCTGHDDIFVADYTSGPGLPKRMAVLDTTGAVNALLNEARGVTAPAFTGTEPKLDCIVVGACDPTKLRSTYYEPIMNQVKNGATLVILDKAEMWAQLFDNINGHQALQYTSAVNWGNRGRFVVGTSTLLAGLPNAQSMNWEYQVFYRGYVGGLIMNRGGNEMVVALAAQNRRDIVTAVSRIPFGNGQIILSTLDMLQWLGSPKPQAATAKKLFMNFVELGGK